MRSQQGLKEVSWEIKINNVTVFNRITCSAPFKREKVRICEIMSGGFAVKIQQCVKNVGRFSVTFSLC